MSNKLQQQTVYVPVDNKETNYVLNYAERASIKYLEQLPGVYVLTGKELADLLTEYEYSLHGNSTSFLKEKGVEI